MSPCVETGFNLFLRLFVGITLLIVRTGFYSTDNHKGYLYVTPDTRPLVKGGYRMRRIRLGDFWCLSTKKFRRSVPATHALTLFLRADMRG